MDSKKVYHIIVALLIGAFAFAIAYKVNTTVVSFIGINALRLIFAPIFEEIVKRMGGSKYAIYAGFVFGAIEFVTYVISTGTGSTPAFLIVRTAWVALHGLFAGLNIFAGTAFHAVLNFIFYIR